MKELKYEKRIVLYLDILGFKSSINESRTNPTVFNLIHKALNNIYSDKFQNENGPMKGVDFGTQISVFSDNIVFSEPYGRQGSFFSFIYSVYWLVNEILWDGFLTRGAVVIGDLYHDEKIVFGPALNEAYRLESEMAIYPRVIMKREDFVETNKTALYGDVDEQTKYLNAVLSVDEDGLIFLNNLTKKHEFDDDETYIALLSKVRKIIVDGLKNGDVKVRSKYEWLKTQYNKLYDDSVDAKALGRILE